MTGNPSSIVVFTIVAKNYLAAARTLMDSVGLHCPEAVRVVVLVDSVDGYFRPEEEAFSIIDSQALDIPKINWFHFKYAILELSTAIKPYAIQHLFQAYGAERVIYFDPDIKLYSDLHLLNGLLDSANVLLTPHLTLPLRDNRLPGEIEILRSGAYNLGFIAVRRSEETFRLLRWWQEKLYDQCVVDLKQGLFVDQKWMDLAPGLFDGVVITRRARFNVAYWNIQHRILSNDGERILVNGEPLCFFHFSGYNPLVPAVFSRHQNRYMMEDLGLVREIVENYGRELLANGHAISSRWPYAYSYFDNGRKIPELCRPVHHESSTIMDQVSNPFSDEGFEVFLQVWNSPARKDRGITKLAYRIYQMRGDVGTVMPDVFGRDYHRFLKWFTSSGKAEHSLDSVFLAPIESVLRQAILSAGEGAAETAPWAASAVVGGAGIAVNGSGPAELIRRIHQSRADLQHFYPDPEGADEIPYLAWVLSHGSYEYALTALERSALLKKYNDRTSKIAFHNRISLRVQLQLVRHALRVKFRAKHWLAGLSSTKPVRKHPAREPVAVLDGKPASSTVNLVGYASASTGVGQSVRAAELAFKSSGFNPHIVTVQLDGRWNPEDLKPQAASVFYINADQSKTVVGVMNGSRPASLPRIGYWAWELDTFSSEWKPAFDLFHEIWTPSSFCTSAMAKVSSKPVVSVPHPIYLDQISRLGKTDFSIPEDSFVFLCAFDMLSVFQRKNPLAAIASFRQAFPAEKSVRLMVKVNNGAADRANLQKLVDAAAADPRISIMDACLTRGDQNALLACCDCYVSLHRSEGFGLMIAEAMWLGKPVIVTNYSGNTDFTNGGNAFLVGYDLRPVGPGCAPYGADQYWADPRIEEASEQMRLVFEQPALRSKRGAEACRYVRAALSPKRIGEIVTERLRGLGVQIPSPV